MRNRLTAGLLTALVLWPAVPARALTDADQKVIDRGLDSLYRCDYGGAEKIFLDALEERPHDPPLSLGYAIATWWRMENEFGPAGSPEEERFLVAVKDAIADAERVVAKKTDPEAYVCLGAAYGLRGRLEAARKRWLHAYMDGRRSYKAEERALELDPKLDDAYLGLGAFDYYASRLSHFVRHFMFAKGDKDKGLAELARATHGHFSADAARLLIVGIDWTFEKKPDEAKAILDELHARYADSPLIDFMRLIDRLRARDTEALRRDAKTYLEKAENGAPHFRPIDRAAGHYFLGVGEELAGHYEVAIAEEKAALELIPEGNRARGVPKLFIGECLDLMGKRDEAVKEYKEALQEPQFWGAQRYAKFLLKKPFRVGDNPLPAQSEELE